MAESSPPLAGAGSGLSAESRKILTYVPSGLDRKKRAEAREPFTMDRTDPRIAELFPDEGYSSSSPVGISIEVKRPDVNVNYELEKAYNALIVGNQREAIEIYRNVLKNSPNNKLALFGLATTYHRAGQLNLARPLYGRLLAIDPDNREALNNFMALIAEENPQEALHQLSMLRVRNPDFSPIPAQMALIEEKEGNYNAAISDMRRALELSPENLSYRHNLAIIYDKAGQGDAAASLYRSLLEAAQRGETIPGDVQQIQERLTFLGSNAP